MVPRLHNNKDGEHGGRGGKRERIERMDYVRFQEEQKITKRVNILFGKHGVMTKSHNFKMRTYLYTTFYFENKEDIN